MERQMKWESGHEWWERKRLGAGSRGLFESRKD